MRLIFFVIVSEVVHVAEPTGTSTVSPGNAAVMAATTSARDGEAALIVAAEAGATTIHSTQVRTRRPAASATG
jgi:hypothetical protein